MWVSYYIVLLWSLQIAVPMRVLYKYSTATGCAVVSVTVASEYPHCTLKGDYTLLLSNLALGITF